MQILQEQKAVHAGMTTLKHTCV